MFYVPPDFGSGDFLHVMGVKFVFDFNFFTKVRRICEKVWKITKCFNFIVHIILGGNIRGNANL